MWAQPILQMYYFFLFLKHVLLKPANELTSLGDLPCFAVISLSVLESQMKSDFRGSLGRAVAARSSVSTAPTSKASKVGGKRNLHKGSGLYVRQPTRFESQFSRFCKVAEAPSDRIQAIWGVTRKHSLQFPVY